MNSLRCRIITIDIQGQRHECPWTHNIAVARTVAFYIARRDRTVIARMYCIPEGRGGPISCGTLELRHPSPPQV